MTGSCRRRAPLGGRGHPEPCVRHRQPAMCSAWEMMSTSRRPTTPSSAMTAAGKGTSSVSPTWPKLQSLRKVPPTLLGGLGRGGCRTAGGGERCPEELGVVASVSLQRGAPRTNARPAGRRVTLKPSSQLSSARFAFASALSTAPPPPHVFSFISSLHPQRTVGA